jgi:hypothetical protein
VTTKRGRTRSTAACLVLGMLFALTQAGAADNKDKKKAEKPYALIFGTAYVPAGN